MIDNPVLGLTDDELRAAPVTVDGTVTVTGAGDATAANQVSGNASLTSIDAKLTNPLPVSGTVTATGPLTDAQIRATPLPVSGTVAVTGVATEATLSALNAKVTAVNTGAVVLAAGSANIGDVDVLTLPALPAGSNNIGDVDVLTLPALPAGTNNIGDVDIVTMPAITGTVTANQGTAGAFSWLTDLRRGQTILFAAINASSNGANTIVAADATKKIKVLSYTIVAAGTVTTTWKSAATSISGEMSWVANTGVSPPMGTPASGWIMETAANEALILTLSSAIQVSGHISYFLEA